MGKALACFSAHLVTKGVLTPFCCSPTQSRSRPGFAGRRGRPHRQVRSRRPEQRSKSWWFISRGEGFHGPTPRCQSPCFVTFDATGYASKSTFSPQNFSGCRTGRGGLGRLSEFATPFLQVSGELGGFLGPARTPSRQPNSAPRIPRAASPNLGSGLWVFQFRNNPAGQRKGPLTRLPARVFTFLNSWRESKRPRI